MLQLKMVPFPLRNSPLSTSLRQNRLNIMVLARGIYDKAFINNEWLSSISKKTFPVFNPSTQDILTDVPDMSEKDTLMAINAAAAAFEKWKLTTGKERMQVLRKWHALLLDRVDEAAKLMTQENGKPLREAIGEIKYSADYLEWYSEEARRIHGEIVSSPVSQKEMKIIKQPIGVVGMLTPWNFPMAMMARKVAAAVAAGCTCVVKPAEDTPLSALYFAEIGEKAGLPKGVLNVVTSSRENAPAVGRTLCASTDVAAISFTGSTAVGKMLYSMGADTVKRISLELGGNAPFIIFESANLDQAVDGLITSKFRNCGQTCICTNRVLVHSSLYEEVVERVRKEMLTFTVGDGLDNKNAFGPLINAAQFKKVESLVSEAVNKGAKIHLGGKPHKLGKTFYEPTLMTDVTPDMAIYHEEIFGPVAVISKFETEEEALRIANGTRSGLASYFYSQDTAQIRRVSRDLHFGIVGVNEGLVSAAEAPFGGVKESGFGKEGSSHGIDEYIYVKYICQGNLN